MEIRRLTIIKDLVLAEGGLQATNSTIRAAACAVIANPFAGIACDDVSELFPYGHDLGALLVAEAQTMLLQPAICYGKAAIVGTAGDIEHGAAILHPRMGRPIRDAIGGGLALIPSNVKIGNVGSSIDVPVGHKDDPWSFDHIDTISIAIGNAPRSDEIVVIIVLADGGRPRPRITDYRSRTA